MAGGASARATAFSHLCRASRLSIATSSSPQECLIHSQKYDRGVTGSVVARGTWFGLSGIRGQFDLPRGVTMADVPQRYPEYDKEEQPN